MWSRERRGVGGRRPVQALVPPAYGSCGVQRRLVVEAGVADLEALRGEVRPVGIQLLGDRRPRRIVRMQPEQRIALRDDESEGGGEGREVRVRRARGIVTHPIEARARFQVEPLERALADPEDAQRSRVHWGYEGFRTDGRELPTAELHTHCAIQPGPVLVGQFDAGLVGIVGEHRADLAVGLDLDVFVVVPAEADVQAGKARERLGNAGLRSPRGSARAPG